MRKKNIDQLFQERFENFSESPDEKVWENIKGSLDKKKRNRKSIPIWWKLGGIASLLAIGLMIFNPLGNHSDSDQITNEQHESDIENRNTTGTEEGSDIKNNMPDMLPKSIADTNLREGGGPENSLATKEALDPLDQKKASDRASLQKEGPEVAVTANNATDKDKRTSKVDKEVSNNIPNNPSPSAVADVEEQRNIPEQNDLAKPDQNRNEQKDAGEKRQLFNAPENALAYAKERAQVQSKDDSQKASIFAAVEQKEADANSPNENVHKWSVGANIAPVYFNGLGEGSPIHASFSPNAKSGEINLSYGLSVGYALSKKLKIRSGINKVDFGYDTNDVEFSSSFASSAEAQIPNIDYTVTSENLFVASKTGANAFKNELAFDASSIDTSRDGIMTQRFGYLEIPLELNYAVLDRRFGVNVIGGVSSLFLVENSVALTSGNLTTEIGTANNLNDINFSTNIGFGLDYKFSTKVQINIEPVFKYQLNTFSNTAGNFQPFSMGIYSGLNFRF